MSGETIDPVAAEEGRLGAREDRCATDSARRLRTGAFRHPHLSFSQYRYNALDFYILCPTLTARTHRSMYYLRVFAIVSEQKIFCYFP